MKIRIHYSLALFGFVFLFTGFFREFLLFFLVIFAHELGHFLVARLFKQRIEHLTYTVLGGILKMEMTEISRFKQLLIYSAGIFVNLLLFLILKTLPDSQFKKLFANYNLLLICFNLLPIHPLDGFQIFQVLLSFFNSPYREFRISSLVSYLVLGAFFLLVFFARLGLGAWIILVFLLYQNINYSVNKNNIILKKIINNYRRHVKQEGL